MGAVFPEMRCWSWFLVCAGLLATCSTAWASNSSSSPTELATAGPTRPPTSLPTAESTSAPTVASTGDPTVEPTQHPSLVTTLPPSQADAPPTALSDVEVSLDQCMQEGQNLQNQLANTNLKLTRAVRNRDAAYDDRDDAMRLLGNARNNASQLQQQLTLAEINTRNSTLFVRLAACKKQLADTTTQSAALLAAQRTQHEDFIGTANSTILAYQHENNRVVEKLNRCDTTDVSLGSIKNAFHSLEEQLAAAADTTGLDAKKAALFGTTAAWLLLILPPIILGCCLWRSPRLQHILAVQLDFTSLLFLGVWWTLMLICLYDGDPIYKIRKGSDDHWHSFAAVFSLGYLLVIFGSVASLWRRARRKQPLHLETVQLTLALLVGVALLVKFIMLEVDPNEGFTYHWYLTFVLIFSTMAILSLIRVCQTEERLDELLGTKSEVQTLVKHGSTRDRVFSIDDEM